MKKENEQINYKELDRKSLLNYLKGKKDVSVEQIEKDEVVHPLRLYPIIQEFFLSGDIDILTVDNLGAPTSIRLK